jgi:hypothetical protein
VEEAVKPCNGTVHRYIPIVQVTVCYVHSSMKGNSSPMLNSRIVLTDDEHCLINMTLSFVLITMTMLAIGHA